MKNAYELAENILKSKPDKNIELKSSDSFASIELYGTSACKKVQDTEFCECFHLENESGTGMITLYYAYGVLQQGAKAGFQCDGNKLLHGRPLRMRV